MRYFVTGAGGQDGHYMLDHLSASGIDVHGLFRSDESARSAVARSPHTVPHVADIADGAEMKRLVESVEPTHIVNLAGVTSVEWSWRNPVESAEVLGVGPVRLLEAAWRRQERTGQPIRFLQASSAEVFGDCAESPQNEATPHRPVTPYGAAKSFAQQMVETYRLRGLFASSAILYNHESPRRPDSFVARKISRAAAGIALGRTTGLALGNIDVRRDWGYAPDYVDAMVRIISAPAPGDYIVASGVSHSVRDFVERAFAYVGINDWSQHVVIDESLLRPADPRDLVGDPSKLRGLGWSPSLSFEQLVQIMVEADLADIRNETHDEPSE